MGTQAGLSLGLTEHFRFSLPFADTGAGKQWSRGQILGGVNQACPRYLVARPLGRFWTCCKCPLQGHEVWGFTF